MRSTASARSRRPLQAADKQLREQRGDVERAIHEVIENNVRIAGAQGFATNVGGMITMAVTIPANVTGLAIIQCRMVAGIAHLRGHDLADPRVRNAILALLLGEEQVRRAGQEAQAAQHAHGDRHGPGPRPDHRPRHLGGRRDRHRRAGRRQAAGDHRRAGRFPLSAAWSAWVPTATPPGASVATPTARCCRVGGSPAAGASRRRVTASRRVSPCARAGAGRRRASPGRRGCSRGW